MAEAKALEPESAQLLAWAAAAGLNQLVIGWHLPPAEPKTTLLHHTYDAGQLLVLGALSWLVVNTVRRIARRGDPNAELRRRTEVAGLALAVLLVGLATLGGDVSNLAERSHVAPSLLTLGAALGFAAVLGASRLLSVFKARATRVAQAGREPLPMPQLDAVERVGQQQHPEPGDHQVAAEVVGVQNLGPVVPTHGIVPPTAPIVLFFTIDALSKRCASTTATR